MNENNPVTGTEGHNNPTETSKKQQKFDFKAFLFKQPLPVYIMLYAGIAFGMTYWAINENIINYSKLPEKVGFYVNDAYPDTSHFLVISKKVTSLQPLDSVGSKISSRLDDFYIYETLIHQNPAFLVWIMLILVMVAIAGGACPVFVYYANELKKEFKLENQLVNCILFSFVVLAFMMITSIGLNGYYDPVGVLGDFSILLEWEWLLPIIVAGTALLMSPSFAVIYLINKAAQQKRPLESTVAPQDLESVKKELEDTIGEFELLHETLKIVLQVHAVIVVFSALTSNALGMSIRAVLKIEHFDIYPKEVPLVYGMFFSLFLCGLYIPTYVYLKTRYKAYSQKVPRAKTEEEGKWLTDLLAKVKMDGSSMMDSIKTALTLLSPLLSVLLPEAFKLFK